MNVNRPLKISVCSMDRECQKMLQVILLVCVSVILILDIDNKEWEDKGKEKLLCLETVR